MNGKHTLALLLVMMGVLLLGTSQVTGQQEEPQNPEGSYSYAFTYQGQLKGPGGPVNGTCDLSFKLFDAAGGGTQVGSTVTHEGVELADGLFTARLDFGGVHDGNARWLEVAVRCPAGSGSYVTLDPRQELTGAPVALALALPFRAEANIGGPLASFVNTSGDGEAGLFVSQQGVALWVESPASEGLRVATAGQDGVRVVDAAGSGLAVDTAGGDGVFVNTAHNNGVKVNSADYNGVQVDSTGGDGVYVGSAGDDGVFVRSAGKPSATTPSDAHNGFEVAGAEGHGLYVGRADAYGVVVDSTNDDGIFIGSAGGSGYCVASANANGLAVGGTGGDGVYIHQAGTPSDFTSNAQPNGFEVAGAQGYGLYVGRADLDGVYVNSTAWHGVNVNGAGVNGVYVTNAGNYGVAVASAGAGGVYGHSANGPGLRGESDQNDGVVGWTGSGSKSGVFGYSQTGNGVAGISDGQYGVLAITTSSDPNEAALLARNEGAGPAVQADGDLVVTGAYRGDIGPNGGAPFPRPAYDSGWIPLARGEIRTLTHNLGGNIDNYVIDMSHRDGLHGYNNIGDGLLLTDGTWWGYNWSTLNAETVNLWRGSNDWPGDSFEYRLRIWVYR
jgi:hypothetical protein